MKYLHLIFRSLARRKLRTLLTTLSIAVAFVLFGYLAAINIAFSMGIDVTGVDRLLMINKVALIQPLPLAHLNRIEAAEGVADVAYATWFGGRYQDKENQFPVMAFSAERFLRLYPEYTIPDDQRKAWLANRTAAMVGVKLAERYGWKLGDRVPLQGNIYQRRDGSDTWEFTIDAIYVGDKKGVDETQFFFRHDYLEENRQEDAEGLVGWYVLRIDDPENAVEITKRLDASFANSPWETETSTEKAFLQGFANQVGNIGAILRWVLIAAFLMILLMAGVTMAQSVRERTGELGVLKTLGFTDGTVLRLVLAESLSLAVVGGGLGLLLGWVLVGSGDPTGGFLPVFYIPTANLIVGVGFILLLGLAAGILPAWFAMRLRIVDALRKN